MQRYYTTHQYLLDPHSAVAVGVAEQLHQSGALGSDQPTLCMLTAHPAKFPASVALAVGSVPAQAHHESLDKLRSKPHVFVAVALEQCETHLRTAIANE
jgi:threonine synthase